MQELINVYKERGNDFINDLFGSYVVVTEKLSGSSFAFEKTGQGLQYFKGNSGNPINLIDRTLMIYYEPAIKYIIDKTKSILSSIPDNWRFCFQYFVHNEPGVIKYDKLPKNNLVLTHIQIMSPNGKIAKVIDDPRVIADWSNRLDVTSLQPVFQGRLSDTQKKQIKNFLDIPIEDQMETFGTSSFSSYILSILNPSIGSTLLQDDASKPIDSFIFRFYKPGEAKAFSTKLIDPYTRTLMKNHVKEDPRRAPADMNEIILLDILSFIEERGLRKNEILSTRPDERYLELVTAIFNDYVDRRGSDLKNLDIEKADFVKSDEFNLNLDMITNERAKERLSKDESLRDLYKIMIGSLKKKRDPDKAGVILTPSVIEDFNKMITKIEEIVYMETGEKFKTFADYLKMKHMNESIFYTETTDDLYESKKSDQFEIDIADEINKLPNYTAERPKVSTGYSDVLVTDLDFGRRCWLEVKMNHTDNLSNPRIFYDGEMWDTTYSTEAARVAIEIMNDSKEAAEFIKSIKEFTGKDYIKIPTTKSGLKDPNAVSISDMKRYFSQLGINRYITAIPNMNLGKIVTNHYLLGKSEPVYYMQANDDFYMIGNENPLDLSKNIPVLNGIGTFKIRISTRSQFYEVQAEIKIDKLPNSKYSIKPGTKKLNPFINRR